MIEELKQILSMVEKVPETVLWVLAGFGIYKLVVWLSTTGAVVMLIKLAIEKLHDALMRPKVVHYRFNDHFILTSAAYSSFMRLIETLRKDHLNFVHSEDIEFLIQAVNEKREREKVKS